MDEMKFDAAANSNLMPDMKTRLKLLWDKSDKTLVTVASSLLAAAIGFGSAVVGANMTRAADESMQFKQARQAQYGQVLAGFSRDVDTYTSTISNLMNGEIQDAADRIQAHRTTENIAYSQASVLWLYPNDEISKLALDCVNASSGVSAYINSSIAEGQLKEGDSADAIADTVLEKVNDLQSKTSSLRNKMRDDLDFPE